VSVRYVVYGAGAVGGVVGARLAQAGHDVALIARGAHLAAIQNTGLRLITPAEDVTLQIPAAEGPAQLEVGRDGDIVLLAVKSQDTVGALEALRAAGAGAVPIVCLQNGVENERAALRRFSDVYGAVVIAPTNHLEAGIVEAAGAKLSGFIDIGRYPSGVDALAEEIAAALSGARISSRAVTDVMRLKYAKLLLNLGNVVGALFAESPDRDELRRRVGVEGEKTLAAAGIVHEDPGGERRRDELAVAPIPGRPRGGSSTWQSLARGSASRPPSVETDYLNGEISLLGRMHGVGTPLNDRLCALADAHARQGGAPGELDAADVLSGVEALTT
jgi:2-dehydropantoate 2-reductase